MTLHEFSTRKVLSRAVGDFDMFKLLSLQPANSTGGENNGRKIMESDLCFDSGPIDIYCPSETASCFDTSYTDPVFDYSHNSSSVEFSVTKGFVYCVCNYPTLYGYYICADYVKKTDLTL